MSVQTRFLYIDLARRQLVNGPNDNGALSALSFMQGDTYQLALNALVPNTDPTQLTVYDPGHIDYATLEAGLTFIDAAPTGGDWEITAGTGGGATTTGVLPFNISKEQLAAALNGLANVAAAGGLAVEDVGPANYFWIQWNTPANAIPLAVSANALQPLCFTRYIEDTAVPGHRLIKLFQAPIAFTNQFTLPEPPPISITEKRNGSALANEIQQIVVPATAVGSFSLNGGSLIDVDTVTANVISSELNAPYIAVNPADIRYSVTAASTPGTYNVEFVGAFAAAPQELISWEMFDQVAIDVPTGILRMDGLPVEEALDGAPTIPVTLEIVAIDGAGNRTTLAYQQVTVVAQGIDAQTGSDIETVSTTVQTVYVYPTETDPVAIAKLGMVAAIQADIAEDGTAVVTHNFNTLQVDVLALEKLQLDPEEWGPLVEGPTGDFTWKAINPNQVQLTFAAAHPATPAPPAIAPVGAVNVWICTLNAVPIVNANLRINTDQVQGIGPNAAYTLTQIITALQGALPTGWPNIPANKIVGTLGTNQIDLTGLSTALATNAAFLTTLQTLATNQQFLTSIFGGASTNQAFLDAITNIFANSTTNTADAALLAALVTAMLGNPTFAAAIATQVTNALQDGSQLPAGVITLYNIPGISDLFPAPRTLPTSTTPAVTATQTTGTAVTTGTNPDTTTQNTQVTTVQTTPATTTVNKVLYAPLPMAVANPVDKGTINGELPVASPLNANWKYLVQGSATARVNGQRRGCVFPDGTIVVSDGRQWYAARLDGGSYYPLAMERELFTLPVQLTPGTRFSTSFSEALALLGDVAGEYLLRIRTGVARQTSGGGMNLSQIAWDAPVLEKRLILCDVPTVKAFGYTVTCAANGTLTATSTLEGQTNAATLPSGGASFVVMASLECFDVSDSPDAFGAVSLIMGNARASVIIGN
jgi:hypothetical protein